jgi:secreted trypsin-like serine protease
MNFVGSLHLRDEVHKNYDFFCSAVLVSATQVLTAGHCIEGLSRQLYDDAFFLHHNSHFLRVRFNGKYFRVKKVSFTRSYFESTDRSSEDLALIELASSVTNVAPVKYFSGELQIHQEMYMAAKGLKAKTKLLSGKRYGDALVLQTDGSTSGTCGGDSGGALLTRVNNTWALVGILTYDDADTGYLCVKKHTISYGPRGHF